MGPYPLAQCGAEILISTICHCVPSLASGVQNASKPSSWRSCGSGCQDWQQHQLLHGCEFSASVCLSIGPDLPSSSHIVHVSFFNLTLSLHIRVQYTCRGTSVKIFANSLTRTMLYWSSLLPQLQSSKHCTLLEMRNIKYRTE